jgi:hypothetical protein
LQSPELGFTEDKTSKAADLFRLALNYFLRYPAAGCRGDLCDEIFSYPIEPSVW